MQFYVLASTEFGRPKFKMGKFPIPFFDEKKNQNSDIKFVKSVFEEEYSVGNIKNKIYSGYSSKEEVIKFKLMIKKLIKPNGIIAYYLLLLIFIKSLSKEKLNYKLNAE